MGKCDLPDWVAPRLPKQRKAPARAKPRPEVQPWATWPFPAEVRRERARSAAAERYAAVRAARVEAAGGEEAYQEKVRARKAATITRVYADWLARLTPEQKFAHLSKIGKKGGGAPWADAEAKRAHLARLGRANAIRINAALTPEKLAARGRRISEAKARRKLLTKEVTCT